ncbi:D-sedoheptulose 7-phosphate isomerase [Thermoproteota archaeon]
MKHSIQKSFVTACQLTAEFISKEETISTAIEASKSIAHTFQKQNKVLICGNGGSMCDAMHFAEELTGRFRKNRPPLPAIALSDPAFITCTANDFSFDDVFSRGVEAYGNKDDILIVLSTSGNSKNVIKAVKKAQDIGMTTIALLGKNGGKLNGKCTMEWIVPGETTDRIQELHMMLLHVLIEEIENLLFPD